MATFKPGDIPVLLREVSRSFNTTLRVLPRAVRRPIGLAYLLARATDTVADTELVPPERRMEVLRALQHHIAGDLNPPLELKELSARQATTGEARLLTSVPNVLNELNRLSSRDQAHIREVLQIITSGQLLDLERFSHARSDAIVALTTAPELDDYTYRVAGCVGEFWTRLCQDHLFRTKPDRLPALLRKSVQFGQGLQLVNILRDLPADLRAGRCYLPSEQLAKTGLAPKDLLDCSAEPLLRPLYDRWLHTARENLLAGWDYTKAIPWRCFRLRLACAWPILIGLDTLGKLATQNVLDPSHRIKISRPAVRRILIRSALALPWPFAWHRLVNAQSDSQTPSRTVRNDPHETSVER